MDQIFVTPKPGVNVRDPHTKKHVPEVGTFVQRTSYWLRRQADGDIVIQTVPALTARSEK